MAGDKNQLPLQELTAISPLDGRYHAKTQSLASFVSEFGLIKNRLEIEVRFLLALSQHNLTRKITQKEERFLKSLYEDFSFESGLEVKEIEKKARHDVKSVERFFRKAIEKSSVKDLTEMIHFGLTSEDVNNLSYRLMLKRASHQVTIPYLEEIILLLSEIAKKHAYTPMLARTHGQPAVPTTLGKELAVFALRLQKEITKLKSNTLTGKLNGAVGNYNALNTVFPKTNWISFSNIFIKDLGLTPNIVTTQINTYEDVIEYLQIYERINGIIVDFNQDMWRYISDNWFLQKAVVGEVGSSTMPQKINPIDFENSEGNMHIANSLIDGLTRKLSISRLQRDLSDSTTIRNIGTILGYCSVGYLSLLTGISRVSPNIQKIEEDLLSDWSILTEGVQTILRCAGIADPYSLISKLSRGKHITEQSWNEWIISLPIDTIQKEKIKSLTPKTYIGIAPAIVEYTLKEITRLKK